MQRLILVPQYPTTLRYQEWWYTEFPKKLSVFFEVIVLGHDEILSEEDSVKKGDFAPIKNAINFELIQIYEYMELKLRSDDVLLLNDLSFPGLFSNILFHKPITKAIAFCHATSINTFDYFESVVSSKWPVEKAMASLFNYVIVGSKYHADKLNWPNLRVLPLPFPPFADYETPVKKYDIVSVSRQSQQKRNLKLEEIVEKALDIKIHTLESINWDDYYSNLSKSKVMFISSSEETFGYQIVDALKCGCIPIAPNKFSYPELLPEEYLYDSPDQAITRVYEALSGDLNPLEKLKISEQSDKFYDILINYLLFL